jgi:hypothetical protein
MGAKKAIVVAWHSGQLTIKLMIETCVTNLKFMSAVTPSKIVSNKTLSSGRENGLHAHCVYSRRQHIGTWQIIQPQ